MNMYVAMLYQPLQVGLSFGIVLLTRDALLHLRIKTLNAHFKLQHTWRKKRNLRLEGIRQMVGYDLKVHKQGRLLCT